MNRLLDTVRTIRIMDIFALVLTGVGTWTVMQGAQILRGQTPVIAFSLAAGVQGATFCLDKNLVRRLRTLDPRQNLFLILVCWVFFFAWSVYLSTLTTFQVVQEEIRKTNVTAAQAERWVREREKIVQYKTALISALRDKAQQRQHEVEQERQEILAARASGQERPRTRLNELRDDIRSLLSMQGLAERLPVPGVDAPSSQVEMGTVLSRARDEATRLYASFPEDLRRTVPPIGPPESATRGPEDLQSLLWNETRKKTWPAMVAFAAAALVELLPLLAMLSGLPKLTAAERIRAWRLRMAGIRRAWKETPAEPDQMQLIPVVIQPLGLSASLRVVAQETGFTFEDLKPLLGQMQETIAASAGNQLRITGATNASDVAIDPGRPLLPQLGGGPLQLAVEAID